MTNKGKMKHCAIIPQTDVPRPQGVGDDVNARGGDAMNRNFFRPSEGLTTITSVDRSESRWLVFRLRAFPRKPSVIEIEYANVIIAT